MKPFLQILMVISIFLSAGCQETTAPVTATFTASPEQAISPTETTMPKQIIPQTPVSTTSGVTDGVDASTTVTPDPNSQQITQIAMNDLAQKLQIDAKKINLSSMEAVTWPDGSLGCPKRGVVYIQALTPGFKLVLEAGRKLYPYHTDENETVVFCGFGSGAEQFMAPTP